MRGPLTVAQVAEALGTSPQTVRALLRKGQLLGEQRPWGSRYVWEVSSEGLDDFLSTYGRLDGHRRSPQPVPVATPDAVGPLEPVPPAPTPPREELGEPPPGRDDDPIAEQHVDRRPFVLRPRGRATVAVVVLGLPLLLAYAVVRTVPDALWFDELGQGQVFRGFVEAKIEFRLLVAGVAAVFIWINLLVACADTSVVRRRAGLLALGAAALVAGTFFASAVAAALADLSPVAASPALRRARPGARQGRRLLRLHAPLRGPGLGPPPVARRRGRGVRRGGPRRTRHRGPATASRDVPGAAAPRRTGSRVPARGRVEAVARALPARAAAARPPRQPFLRRRGIRRRPRPHSSSDGPRLRRRSAGRRQRRHAVRRAAGRAATGAQALRGHGCTGGGGCGHRPDRGPRARATVRRRPQPAVE